MKATKIDVPDDLLELFGRSRLATRAPADQVKIAIAIHLFQEGLVSIGRAAELSGEPRAAFEILLGEMGIPPARYDEADYEREWSAIQRAQQS